MKIRAGIIGGAGYTGGETIRLLINHPDAEISFVHSKSNAGKFLYEVHEDLTGETELKFVAEWNNDVDTLFLCMGHGESKKFIEAYGSSPSPKIIDLSQDYRLHSGGKLPLIGGQPVVYGLPELNKAAIRQAQHIANPGCFATAIQLGLLPLAAAGLLGEVYTTGITGSTGAGQSLSTTSHFSWRANNIQAYKTLTHQHLKEVGQSLQQLQPSSGGAEAIHFVPWRGDFTRGIFVSSQLRCDRSLSDLETLYENFYRDHPFTVLSRKPISLKQVVNNNKCLIQLEKQDGQLVVHSVIDNLLKGASGQAVQNMNLLFGLDETAGLHLKANAF
ncbi:MAG TPA: N-acetyl-gamma-glutamyl-phosphate reductase [Puia sp.]|jgi:N-acetyl-gamma-glutamyl-phosphate reductase